MILVVGSRNAWLSIGPLGAVQSHGLTSRSCVPGLYHGTNTQAPSFSEMHCLHRHMIAFARSGQAPAIFEVGLRHRGPRH